MENQQSHDATLTLEHITFSWQNNKPPLLNIPSLQLERGEHLFLYGASGSGKTTLLNIICGILKPSRGEVFIGKQSLYGLSTGKRDVFRSKNIGLIFQQLNLIPYLSVLENVLLPAYFAHRHDKTIKERARQLLESLGFQADAMTKSASQLSVGQQQRVAIARALLLKPSLLVADEPTSALDSDNRDKFMELLLSEAEQHGTSVIFVSHDRSLAKHFQRTLDIHSFKDQAVC
ncbi:MULTISPECIES: ABC transporter ATP-binding protein [Gammaproteobacteria]|uniref:ABC transporter ATP-binding protein n=1 Tax=Gammaproteobacteria TaxID=1236 RepID=UPI000DCFAC24|nr:MULTISPECIES: ABC transporter ATP-binding protein [Gammaproteobacteria]RTE87350.1 ABC transporter ATP-binding protein [Aliidiomarina sp. B3213]TCZ92864.1 ABC transporter ATP-binding protein [Lysobacter sp. N42]